MGYYTDFELEIVSGEEHVDRTILAQELSEISTYAFDEEFWLNAKWYDFMEDMKKVSLLYPNTLFRLNGNGEESGDMWQCYYKDGKSQFCKSIITYEPFDESKLQ